MPINRPDGRHWCDPGSQRPNSDGRWTCTCGQGWRLDWDNVWRTKGSDIPERPKPEPLTTDEKTVTD